MTQEVIPDLPIFIPTLGSPEPDSPEDCADTPTQSHASVDLVAFSLLNSNNVARLRQERDRLQLAGLRKRHTLLHQLDRSTWPALFAALKLLGRLSETRVYENALPRSLLAWWTIWRIDPRRPVDENTKVNVDENTKVKLWWKVEGQEQRVKEEIYLNKLIIQDEKLMGKNGNQDVNNLKKYPLIKDGDNFTPIVCYVRRHKICFTKPDLQSLFKEVGNSACGDAPTSCAHGGTKRKTSKKSHRKST